MQATTSAQDYAFQTVRHVEAGVGACARLGELAGRYAPEARVAMLVTDAGVRKAGLLEPALRALRTAGLQVQVFDGVQADPPDHVALFACTQAREAGAGLVIGLGGGRPPRSRAGPAAAGARAVPSRERVRNGFGDAWHSPGDLGPGTLLSPRVRAGLLSG